MDPASWKLTGEETLIPIMHQQHNMDPASWGGNTDPNYTSSGCMLMQVDWGGKLRPNHINECMPSEADWELMKPIKMDTASLKLIGEIMTHVFTLWMDACSMKLIGEPRIQVSSFTLCTLIMMHCQQISSPKDCGEDYHKGHLPPLSWSTGNILLILDKLKMDFPTPNQSRDIEAYTLLLTLNNMKVVSIYLPYGILGRNLCNLHSSGRKAQVSSLPKQRERQNIHNKTGFILIPNGTRGTHNPNVTLKGYPKKFWGLFGQKAHKTQQITLFQPQKGGLSLTQTRHGQTYNPKCKPKQLTNEMGSSWDGHVYSMCNTAKLSDWLISRFFIGYDDDINISVPI